MPDGTPTMTESNAQSLPRDGGAVPAVRRSLLARVNTFCAVVPLGVFLVLHTLTTTRMVYGRRAFNESWAGAQELAWLPLAEVVFVALPLVFHAAYGIAITLRGDLSPRRDPGLRTWLLVLQRATGVFALVFVGLHVWHYRAQRAVRGVAWVELYRRLGVDLNAPARYALYAAGVMTTAFHFAYGLHLALGRSGLVRSPSAARRSAWACGLAGALLVALGINTLAHFALKCGGVLPLPGRHAAQVCGTFAR